MVRKQSGQCFFFVCFFSPQSNGFITEKTLLFQGSRGGPSFPRGGGLTYFQGDQMLIAIETHIT